MYKDIYRIDGSQCSRIESFDIILFLRIAILSAGIFFIAAVGSVSILVRLFINE